MSKRQRSQSNSHQFRHEEREPNSQGGGERSAVLLDGQEQDGEHQHGREEHLDEQALDD